MAGIFCLMLFCFALMGWLPACASEEDLPEAALPADLTEGLAYLLAFNDPNRTDPPAFDSGRVARVLEFILAPKAADVIYTADEKLGKPSAYAEFDLDTDLERLIRIAYSPDIPGVATAPSSLRLTYWTQVNGNGGKLPKLWEVLPDLDKPVVVTGTAYEEITPDVFSGAYYGYDLDRTLILFKYQGRRFLISLAKQRDVSEVGKKGVILGRDDQWNYLYTGAEGIPRFGLGWVRSYMYDSYAILVYCETNPTAPAVRLGVFKWVRAGWQDINMVRSFHIYRGINRFAKGLEEVLATTSKSGISVISAEFDRIRQLSQEELKAATRSYLERLKERYREDDNLKQKETAVLFEGDEYVNQLSRREMESILILEYLRDATGKNGNNS